jgi:hypothetical protein
MTGIHLSANARVRDQDQDRVRELAEKLAAVHGRALITTEASGTHIYFPSPYVVEEQGERELSRGWPHGAINADKYLGLGIYSRFRGTGMSDARRCARCMKTGRALSTKQLFEIEPIDVRLGQFVSRKVVDANRPDDPSLVPDENGVLIPRPPGDCTPITELPDNHPAVYFLQTRGYTRSDFPTLEKHLGVSYCYRELPERRGGPWYPRLANGFKDTPQGRLIFWARSEGAVRGWQARILEFEKNNVIWFWHPYSENWVPMYLKTADGRKPLFNGPLAFDYAKYKTGKGTRRNAILMGLDAARAWNLEMGLDTDPIAVLVEGPMDATRLGRPAMPVLGKSFSPEQAQLVVRYFRRLAVVRDRDAGGEQLEAAVRRHMEGTGVRVRYLDLLPGKKDPGEYTETQAQEFVQTQVLSGWDNKLRI